MLIFINVYMCIHTCKSTYTNIHAYHIDINTQKCGSRDFNTIGIEVLSFFLTHKCFSP